MSEPHDDDLGDGRVVFVWSAIMAALWACLAAWWLR